MWCSTAVNFSFGSLLTNCRIRSAPCDTGPHHCVWPVLRPPGFLSIPALPSSASAGACAPLFATFPSAVRAHGPRGTMPGSDFFASCILGFG